MVAVEGAGVRRVATLGWTAGVTLVASVVGSIAAAQDTAWRVHPTLQDKWTLQLGAFFPRLHTDTRLNSSTGTEGTEVKLENDLGFPRDRTLTSYLISMRFGERWKVEGEYVPLSRSNSVAIDRTISWGDRTYAVGTTVDADFNSDVYRLSVGYSFAKSDKAEAGIVIGAHVTDFSVSLSAPRLGGQRGDVLAPLPTVGLYGAYAFTPRWLLSGRADYFSLSYEEYEGSLVHATVGMEYRMARNLGIQVGYRHVHYDLSTSKPSYNGNVDYRFSGPTLYLIGSF